MRSWRSNKDGIQPEELRRQVAGALAGAKQKFFSDDKDELALSRHDQVIADVLAEGGFAGFDVDNSKLSEGQHSAVDKEDNDMLQKRGAV